METLGQILLALLTLGITGAGILTFMGGIIWLFERDGLLASYNPQLWPDMEPPCQCPHRRRHGDCAHPEATSGCNEWTCPLAGSGVHADPAHSVNL